MSGYYKLELMDGAMGVRIEEDKYRTHISTTQNGNQWHGSQLNEPTVDLILRALADYKRTLVEREESRMQVIREMAMHDMD